MSFMDKLNATAKKKQTALPKSASAQNAIVNHSSTIGKSRVQGNQGVTQGNQGWKSQYTNADAGYSKQINPIINSLSQAPTYDAPKIEHKLTTQEGFNEALGVVGARNNAKLASQNQRVLQGVLGSLVSGDSQNRATTSRANIASMNDATKRRGQDFTATAKADALAETKDYHGTLGKYYEGQTANGAERNNIARDKLNNPPVKAINPIDERLKRQKLIKDGGLEGILGSEQFNALSDAQQQDITGKYIMTGELPTLSGGETHWYGDTAPTVAYKSQQQNSPQATTQTSQQPKQETAPKVTGALFDSISKGLGIDRGSLKLSDDGKNIVLPDGRQAPVALLSEKFGV